MADVSATWTADPDPKVSAYKIVFVTTPKGAVAPNPPVTATVPRSAAGDSGGYQALYLTALPTPTPLGDGDSVAVSGMAVDVYGQQSPLVPASGSPVVIAVSPPAPPTGPVGLKAAQV